MTVWKTMRAAVVEEGQEGNTIVEVKHVPIPDVSRDQILVKVICSGVCHTDVHILKSGWRGARPVLPLILGHEGTGIIVALGPAAEAEGRFFIGDRVGIPWLNEACGICDNCLSGWESACTRCRPIGFSLNGCHAEYVATHFKWIARLPPRISFEQAAPIMCAGVTSYKAIKVSKAKPGEWIAVFGASGGLGHVAVQYARAMSLKVLAIDLGHDKTEAIQNAHLRVDGSDGLEAIQKAIQASGDRSLMENGPHAAVVFCPVLEVFSLALKLIRPRGTVVAVSLPPGATQVDIPDLVLHAKTLRGSIVGTRMDLIEALRIAADGNIVCNIHERRLEEISEVLEELEKNTISGRVVLRISEE